MKVSLPQVLLGGKPLAVREFFPPREDFLYQRNPVYFVRFPHAPDAVVEIGWGDGDEPFDVIPEHKVELVDSQPGRSAFHLLSAGSVAVRLPDGPWLFLQADSAAGNPIPSDARNVEEFGITPSAEQFQSDAINAAIEHISTSGGGTLVFPAGTYRITTLFMRSGVTLHLAAGATLLAAEDPGLYPEDPEGVLFADLPRSLIPGPRRRVIYWENCEDAAITGRGTINGQGSEIRRRTCHTPAGRPLINLMKFVHCRHCRVEGVTLLDSEFWNTHVVLSQNIVFDGVQVINERPPRGWAAYYRPGNNWTWNNTDGINPDSSENVEIRNCLFHTGDDCVAVKNTGTYRNEIRDVRNIHVHGNLMLCGTTAMKIGTETRGGEIRDVRFERNHVALCSRVLAAELKDGATARDIVWADTTVEECNRPLDLEVLRRQDQPDQTDFSSLDGAFIRNLEIRKYKTEGAHWQCHLRGLDHEHTLSNVHLEHLRFAGREVDSLESPDFVLGDNGEDVSLIEPIASHPTRRPTLAASAFTLIEMLVVVAILAVLAGLLFPTIGGMLDRSRLAASTSNLRQIGVALASYGSDNDGYLPGGRTPDTAPSPNQNYLRTGNQYTQWSEELTPYVDPNNREPMLTDVSAVFRDPVYEAIAGPIANPSENYRGGFSWNARMGLAHGVTVGPFAPNSSRMTRTKRMLYPGDTIVVGPYFWEAFHPENDGTVPEGRFSITKTQNVNHGLRIGAGNEGTGGRSALYLFLDGSVRELVPGEPNSEDPNTAARYLKLRTP